MLEPIIHISAYNFTTGHGRPDSSSDFIAVIKTPQ
jgi:hypothetical protein